MPHTRKGVSPSSRICNSSSPVARVVAVDFHSSLLNLIDSQRRNL